MECASAGFWEPPTAIPMDATEVYLAGNRFEILGKKKRKRGINSGSLIQNIIGGFN